MTIIKCKMCGGELKIVPETSICECEYCGSKQTIPTTDDEKRLKLYERANKLRYENEFDKAAGVYESIVAEYQDEAEAYWGLVLCKFGIEYVDDPKTGKKIPTCHRSSFDSVMDDSDFDRVMENSDTVARGLYREEAKQIEELRKGIIEVSSKEEAYDIFICYKETAEDGERTLDSVIAQDVYDALTEKGYKVFFSRITLEDKLGQEYEPYIFAALNSARVMLAFGTTYDYYNAVWVKNEWSRFLQLMAAGQKKTLIPCYKNLDAYDMPKEFAKLQAQDMGKVGALQDLLRGIDKIFGRDRKPAETTALLTATGDSNATVKRGYFALEDGEWEKAIQYFDQAMDLDPDNSEIHLGLFLAKRHFMNLDSYLEAQLEKISKVASNSILACKPNEELINKIVKENAVEGYLNEKKISDQFLYKLTYDSIVEGLENEKAIYNDKDWAKAERFAKDSIKEKIESVKNTHLNEIDKRIQEEIQKDSANSQKIKTEYAEFMEKTENSIKEQKIKAEEKREKYYQFTCNKIGNANSISEYQSIIGDLLSLNGYKESQKYIDECKKQIVGLKEEENKQREIRKNERNKKLKKAIIIAACISVLVIAAIVGFSIYEEKVIYPNREYEKACELMEQERYDDAINAFEKMDGYKDSATKIEECKAGIEELKKKELEEYYQSIYDKVDSEDYEGAIADLSSVEDVDIKNQIISYMVDDLCARYENTSGTSGWIVFQGLNKKSSLLLDIATEEQKEKIIKANDETWFRIGTIYNQGKITWLWDQVGDTDNYFSDYCFRIDNYKDDIDKLKAYNDKSNEMGKNIHLTELTTSQEDKGDKTYVDEDAFLVLKAINDCAGFNGSIKYERDTKCLYVNTSSDDSKKLLKLYIITSGDDYFILGETTSEGKYKINTAGELEILEEPLVQDAETFFDELVE